jgi:hypothetical protein
MLYLAQRRLFGLAREGFDLSRVEVKLSLGTTALGRDISEIIQI